MNLTEIFVGSGGVVVLLLSLIQVSKIQINPWSWLAKNLGRAINGEVMDQVKSLTDKVEHMENDLSDARKADERRDIEQRRVRILRFGEELLRNIKHTKEHFDQILIDITVYEKYCKEHPEFENDVTVETISHIKNVYQQCWKEHSFL